MFWEKKSKFIKNLDIEIWSIFSKNLKEKLSKPHRNLKLLPLYSRLFSHLKLKLIYCLDVKIDLLEFSEKSVFQNCFDHCQKCSDTPPKILYQSKLPCIKKHIFPLIANQIMWAPLRLFRWLVHSTYARSTSRLDLQNESWSRENGIDGITEERKNWFEILY